MKVMKVHKAKWENSYSGAKYRLLLCLGYDITSWDYSFRWKDITCKKCLKKKPKKKITDKVHHERDPTCSPECWCMHVKEEKS